MTKATNLITALSGRVLVRTIGAALQAYTLVMVARTLGPAEFGVFALGLSTGVIAGSLLGFGSTTRSLRILREPDPRQIADSLTSLRLLSALGVVGCVALVLLILSAPTHLWTTVALISASDHFCDFEQTKRLGELAHSSSSRILLLQRLLPASAVTLAAGFGSSLTTPYATASIIAFCIALARPLTRLTGKPKLRPAIRGSVGYWANSVGQSAQQLDLFIVTSVAGTGATGAYGAATRVLGPVNLIVNSAALVLAPRFGIVSAPDRRHRAFMQFALVAASGGLLLIALAWPLSGLISVALGADFDAHRGLVAGMIGVAGVGSGAQVLMPYLISEGLAKNVARATIAGVMTGLVVLAATGSLLDANYLWLGLLANYLVLIVMLLRSVRAITALSGRA